MVELIRPAQHDIASLGDLECRGVVDSPHTKAKLVAEMGGAENGIGGVADEDVAVDFSVGHGLWIRRVIGPIWPGTMRKGSPKGMPAAVV